MFDLLDFDVYRNEMDLNGDVHLMWNDSRLAFERGGFLEAESLKLTDLTERRIWVPDVYFPAAITSENIYADGKRGVSGEQIVTIKRDGSITWSRHVRVKLDCPMNFEQFPCASPRILTCSRRRHLPLCSAGPAVRVRVAATTANRVHWSLAHTRRLATKSRSPGPPAVTRSPTGTGALQSGPCDE